MIPFEKEFDPPTGCERGSDFSTGALAGRCSHPRRVLPPAGFRLTEPAVILYIYSFHAGRRQGLFENLSEKFQGVLKKLRGHGRISEGNVEEALPEARLALLEADVNYKVVKEFT